MNELNKKNLLYTDLITCTGKTVGENIAGCVTVCDENDMEKGKVENMTKVMKIEGMMCGHCEARVKKVLEAMDGVAEAVVSHENGTAVVTLSGEVSDETLKQTVEAQDYQVISIE